MKVGDKARLLRLMDEDKEKGLVKGEIYTVSNIEDDAWLYLKKTGNNYPLMTSQVEFVKWGRSPKPKLVKYIARYDENDVDPYKEFFSRRELMKWVKEAQKDSDIDFSSIRVFTVVKEQKVTTKFGLRKA